MKNFVTRSIISMAMVATLGVGIPAAAYASGTTHNNSASTTSTAMKLYHVQLVAYNESLQAVHATFVKAVQTAREAFADAIAVAKTAPLRDAARLALSTAITAAKTARTASLALLIRPVKPTL
jgi:hypothetical protein